MGESRERKFERIWNSGGVASVLILIGAVVAVWANWHLPLPGVSIGILGAMAAIMSLRPEMHIREKAFWMVLISAMLVGEIRSIRADRTATNIEQTKIRNSENQRFAEIAKGLQNSVSALTGGDSYDVILPILVSTARQPEFPLMIYVRGKYTLWDVKVDMRQGPDTLYEANHFAEYLTSKRWTSIDLGSVSTTYGRPLGIPIHPSADKTNMYLFRTWSRNEVVREELDIRFNAKKKRWEPAWKVYREGPEPIEVLDWGESKARMLSH